jgi:hypothetical protein
VLEIILSEKGNILLISNQLITAMGRSAGTEKLPRTNHKTVAAIKQVPRIFNEPIAVITKTESHSNLWLE